MSSQSTKRPHTTAIERAPEKAKTLFGTPPEQSRAQLENSVAEAARKFGFAGQDGEEVPDGAEAYSEEDLRRLLADQRAATIQARADALELQNALAEVQGRLTKTKGQFVATPVNPPVNAPGKPEDAPGKPRPDAILVRAQWERAQKDLLKSLAARSRESDQANAKLAEVTAALQLATEARTLQSLISKRHSRSRMVAGIVVITVVLGVGLFAVSHWSPPKWENLPKWGASRGASRANAPAMRPREAPAARAALAKPPVDAPPTVLEREIPPPVAEMPDNSEVSLEISRLTSALSRFQGVDPEVVMRAVNKKAPATGAHPCAFEWNHGEPVLQFGDRQGGHTTITASLSRCAAAVEQFR